MSNGPLKKYLKKSELIEGKRMIRIIWLAFLLLFSFSSQACLKEGDKVELTGVIKKEIVYGPPSWGENPKNDKKMEYWFLYPNKSLNCPSDVDTKRMQMIMSSEQYEKYRLLLGDDIKVTGKVIFANSPYHFTPILIFHVSNIELTKERQQ